MFPLVSALFACHNRSGNLRFCRKCGKCASKLATTMLSCFGEVAKVVLDDCYGVVGDYIIFWSLDMAQVSINLSLLGWSI